MKKYNLAILTFLLLTMFSISAFSQTPDGFSKYSWRKLGTSLQQKYLDAEKNNNLDQTVQCFLVVNDGAGGEGDQALLFGAGYATQVFSGMTARGHVKLKDLPQVLNLGFIRRIDLAK